VSKSTESKINNQAAHQLNSPERIRARLVPVVAALHRNQVPGTIYHCTVAQTHQKLITCVDGLSHHRMATQ